MKQRIYFQKLFDNQYSLATELEVINWMLKTGKRFQERPWPSSGRGIDQAIFDYSANCYDSHTPFPLHRRSLSHLLCFINRAFTNVLVRTPNPPIKLWREAERVSLDSYRILDFPEERWPGEHDFQRCHLGWHLMALRDYIGMELTKEKFHPDYDNRTVPKIIGIRFHTAGNGYIITFKFSFKEFDYEPGWDYEMSQKEGECLPLFIYRAHNLIRSLAEKTSA